MAKSPARSGQIPMLLPIARGSLGRSIKAKDAAGRTSTVQTAPSSQSNRDALIERLRRDGFFELQKKK